MTNRIVNIILRGDIAGLRASMTAAQESVRDVGRRMTAATPEAARFRQGLSSVGDTAGRMGLVAAAGLGAIVVATANFDKQMSAVQAATHESEAAMGDLREAAIRAGADTAFSASEAAQGIEELAKAGVATADILDGGLAGSLDLAAAGALGVGEAAEIAATAMTQFQLGGDKVSHIADLLAAGAGKAQGSVTDMGMALKQSGLVASQTGLSIEETTGTLAAFASAGLIGSDAGTSFKTMLQSLTPTGDAARETMKKLGITAYDAQGNFVGMTKFADSLKDGLSDLSVEQQNAAMKTIFGSDAVRAASVVFQQGGAGIQSWIDKVNDTGYAAETAATRLDNLAGDMEALKGSLETALIGSGEGSTGALRDMVQGVTEVINFYNDLPGPVKAGTTAIIGFTAAVGLSAFAATRAVGAYTAMTVAMTQMGVASAGAALKTAALRTAALGIGAGLAAAAGSIDNSHKSLNTLTEAAAGAAIGFAVTGGPWGAAIGGSIGLLKGLTTSSDTASDAIAGLTGTLDAQTGAITTNTAQWAAKAVADSKYTFLLQALGVDMATQTDAVLGNAEAMDKVTAATEKAGGPVAANALKSITDLSEGLDKGKVANLAATEAVEGSTEAQKVQSEAMDATAFSAEGAAEAVDALKSSIDALLDPFLAQEDASNAWRTSIASLTEDLQKNGATLNDNTLAGLANQDAIRARVKLLKDSSTADLEAGVAQDVVMRKMLRGAEAIVTAGRAANISEKDMRGYLEQLNLTPDQIETVIKTPGLPAAISNARSLRTALLNIPGLTETTIRTIEETYILPKKKVSSGNNPAVDDAFKTGGAILRADGGSVVGAGTGTSDSISATGPGGANYRLSDGEHIVTADEVDKVGGQEGMYALRAAIRAGRYADMAQRSFASGGGVGSSAAQSDSVLREVMRQLSKGFRIVGPPGSQRLELMGA